MRKISASYIFTLSGPPLKNGIVVLSDDGTIIEVVDTSGVVSEIEGLEHYSGILVPGFVNAHCHLELSHLKGAIEEGTGLEKFLGTIARLRNIDEATQLKAVQTADGLMKHAGIVAVGDISNTLLTYDIKKNSNIYYHTFVECFGFLRERAERAFDYGESLFDLFREAGLASSVCPHAPYSVSEQLFELIGRHAGSHNSILSFHHQESASENEFFLFKKGGLYNHLTKNLGFELDFWSAPGIDATKASLSKIPKENQLLLVHNTFMTTNELSALQEIRSTGNTFLVTCPNANLYIESRLPDYRLWQSSGYPICIGTDSLASNHQLSIVEELKTIQQHQAIATEDILKWACTNGAKALKIDSWAGSLEKGKKPGINLISGVDWNTLFLTPRAKVKKIV